MLIRVVVVSQTPCFKWTYFLFLAPGKGSHPSVSEAFAAAELHGSVQRASEKERGGFGTYPAHRPAQRYCRRRGFRRRREDHGESHERFAIVINLIRIRCQYAREVMMKRRRISGNIANVAFLCVSLTVHDPYPFEMIRDKKGNLAVACASYIAENFPVAEDLFSHYVSKQDYKPDWLPVVCDWPDGDCGKKRQPGMRGGHQMSMDYVNSKRWSLAFFVIVTGYLSSSALAVNSFLLTSRIEQGASP